jgi:biofilm PGA synthesis protein PgaA
VAALALAPVLPITPGAGTLLAQAPDTTRVLAQETLRAQRDTAVRQAREGEHAGAIRTLERLLTLTPSDVGLRGDLAAVLHWAGRDAESLAMGAELPPGELEPIVVESVARAARNEGRPALAVALYQGVVDREPGRLDSQVGLALAHLEAGGLSEALARLPELARRFPESADARMAEGHVLGAHARWIDAALAYRRASALRPGWEEALLAELLALREAGADGLARDRAASMRGSLPPRLLDDLLAGQVARLVEWAPAVPLERGPGPAGAVVDRAVAASADALSRVERGREGDARFPELRLRFDRLVALREREEMATILAEAHALEAEGVTLPPYALRVTADAALALGELDEAERRYRSTLAGWPGQLEATLGLFWTLVEQWEFAAADQLLEAFLEAQPTRRTAEGLREPLPNPDRLPALLARHLGWALAGDLARAQRGLEALHAAAPLNLDLRQELASVYNWRGWPRRADALYLRIVALDPEHVPARIGRIAAALATDERPTAVALADSLARLAPRAETVRRAQRQVEVDAAWQLHARYGQGWSSGGEFGTDDRTMVTEITSAPLAHRVRLHAGTRRADADYPEGRGAHDRMWAGVSLRSRPVRLRLEANADRLGADAPGVAGELGLRGGDHWSFRLGGASRSEVLPIRATLEGIRGWDAQAGIEWRAHEGRRVSLEGGWLEMTDGNERVSAYLALEQQFARTPRHRLAFLAEGYGARNSRTDAPYFNPAETASATGTLLWDWTFFRRHERSYAQRVALGGGAVAQDGLPTLGVATLTVEHAWSLSDRLTLFYGGHAGLPVYDGIRERRASGHLGFTWSVR